MEAIIKSSKEKEIMKKPEVPQAIEWKNDVVRPHESGLVDREEIERSIDKKRIRVAMEAKHKAEKAKAQTNPFGVVSIGRKGGIPTTKLRGINEADFF